MLVKLTVEQIDRLKFILQYTNDLDTNGQPMARSFSMEKLLAYKWFVKNTEEIMKVYNAFIKEESVKLEEEFKDQKEENDKLLGNIKKLLKDESDLEKKGLLENISKFLQSKDPGRMVVKRLNEDPLVLKAFQQDLHEVQIESKTAELIKEVIAVREFGVVDLCLVDILHQLK